MAKTLPQFARRLLTEKRGWTFDREVDLRSKRDIEDGGEPTSIDLLMRDREGKQHVVIVRDWRRSNINITSVQLAVAYAERTYYGVPATAFYNTSVGFIEPIEKAYPGFEVLDVGKTLEMVGSDLDLLIEHDDTRFKGW